MANRYWVGGTASWDGTAGSKWALTSGGAGGQAIPTSSDDVFFDASSGAGTVTIASGNTGCNNLNFTGFTGVWAGSTSVSVSGDLTFGSGMGTITATNPFNLLSTSASAKITTNGINLASTILQINGPAGTYTLQDNLTISTQIVVNRGTFNTGNKNITCLGINGNVGNTIGLTLGSSTITVTGTGSSWAMTTGGNLTLSAGTSTIKLTDASSSSKTFAGGNKTYYNLWLTGAGTGTFIISGGNTFNDFKVDTPPHTIQFPAFTQQTVTTFTVNGTAGNLMTLQSTTNGNAWIISCGTGTITCDYLSIRDSSATGGATFIAGTHSTDVSNNTGWIAGDSGARYWIGGTGNATSSLHWSLSSGGSAGNFSVPSAINNVIIDSNSGLSGGTLTLNNGALICNNFTSSTGFNYNLSNNSVQIHGSAVFESTITRSSGIVFRSTSTGNTITTNGLSLGGFLTFTGVGGGWLLQDDLTTADLYIDNGNLDANGHNIYAGGYYFYCDTGFNPTITMGSGTWNVTSNDVDDGDAGGGVWWVDEYNSQTLTVVPNTSTIKFTDTTSNPKTFFNGTEGVAGGGHTYNNLWLTGSGTGTFIIVGSNTFNDFKVDTPPHTVNFTAGTTTTISTFSTVGTVGNIMTLQSTVAGSAWNISRSSGITASDYLSLKDSHASGGADWYAGAHSTDVSGNTGWIFTGVPYSLSVTVGSFTLTGVAVLFHKILHLTLSVGSFILTGIRTALAFSGWTPQSKSSNSWTNQTKNSSTWTNQNKH